MQLWTSQTSESQMNIEELENKIKEMNFPPDSYSLSGGYPNESLCISENNGRWSIYYSERGLRTEEEIFSPESAACEAFLSRLARMFYNCRAP